MAAGEIRAERVIASVHQISISDGGVPKLPVACATVTPTGIEGDRHRDPRIHGGPERAVCLFSLEVIERLRAEGHPIAPGTAGENVTVAGLDWSAVRPGARLRLGDTVALEIASFTGPCKTIAASFSDGEFGRIAQRGHAGDSRVYARVLVPGRIEVGDPVELVMAPVEA